MGKLSPQRQKLMTEEMQRFFRIAGGTQTAKDEQDEAIWKRMEDQRKKKNAANRARYAASKAARLTDLRHCPNLKI